MEMVPVNKIPDAENDINLLNTANSFPADNLKPKERNEPSVELPNPIDKDYDETGIRSKSIALNNRHTLTDSDDDNNENTVSNVCLRAEVPSDDKSHPDCVSDSNNSNDFSKTSQTSDINDEDLVRNRKRNNRNHVLEDSDSAEENKNYGTYGKVEEEKNNSNKSASENNEDRDLELKKIKRRKVRKRMSVLDSDSSDDEVPESKNSQKVFVNRNAKINPESYVSDGDDSIQVGVRTNSEETATTVRVVDFVSEKSRLKALCDSDSSGCEDGDYDNKSSMSGEFNPIADDEENEGLKPLPYKRKSKRKTLENEEPKKMTGKEATELRQEIKAESQRMLRASNVSLPYHKPKSYSLKEFLEKRSKFTPTSIASAKTTSVAIKMSKEELTIFTKRLKEREKEAKEFFKSESEPEDEEIEKQETQENTNRNQNETEFTLNDDQDKKNISENSLSATNVATEENGEVNKFEEEESEEVLSTPGDEKMIIDDGTTNSANSTEGNDFSKRTFESTKDTHESATKDGICIDNLNSLADGEISVTIPSSLNSDTGTKENLEESSNMSKDFIDAAADLDTNTMEVASNSSNELTVLTPTSDCDVKTEENSNLEQPEETTPIEETKNKINIISNIVLSNNNNLVTLNKSDNLHGSEKDKSVEEDDLNSEMDDVSLTDYQFNLDDLEEDSPEKGPVIFSDQDKPVDRNLANEAFTNENNIPRKKSFYSLDDNTEEDIPEGMKSKIEVLKESVAHIKPKLSGGPCEMIDLTEKPSLPINVAALKERFIKHLTKHDHHNHKVDISVVSISDAGEVQKEVLKMNINEEEIPIVVNEKPGEKLKKLRAELQIQMAKRRSEMWQQKVSGAQSAKNEDEDEKSDCGADDDILDDEIEEDLTEESSEEGEEMDFEDIETMMVEKPKVKSAYVDDEADESEMENEDNEDNDNESDGRENNESEDDEVKEPEEKFNISENEVQEDEQSNDTKKPKSLRRIIKAFTEDSDDESQDEELPQLVQDNFVTTVDQSKSNSIQSLELAENDDDDDFLTPYQNPPSQSQQKQNKLESESFLTPISYFTGIQTLNSASKTKNLVSPLRAIAVEPSPLKDKNWESELQKKLYADSLNQEFESQVSSSQFSQEPVNRQLFTNEHQNTQKDSPDFDETATFSQADDNFNTPLNSKKYENPVVENSTQDLLAVCSGKFTGITQGVLNEITSGELNGSSSIKHINHTLLDNTTMVSLNDERKESKILDEEQNQIISQLLDEEEMEKFKKKFDSPPEVKNKSSKVLFDLGDEVQGGAGVIDSDEENELLIKTKKKQRKLVFSDDEDSSEGENESIKDEEEINLCDNSGNGSEDDNGIRVGDTRLNNQNVEYDSEENEIEGVPFGGYKASDFFENEAELSESEWDSADEDERGMDEMDFELADKEKFDEEKVRADLEKIHMRRMLDEDNHEVKILQELYLDDGELHGAGRQRQFRWKNIDSVGVEEDGKKDDDQEVYIDENESEEQWRKMRYQREQFLRNKSSQSSTEVETESISCSSKLFSFSKVIIKNVSKSEHNTPTNTPAETDDVCMTPETKQPFALLNKRGSFLSRGEQVLQKLAEYTKGAVSNNTFGNIKPSKNFIFQTVKQESDSKGFNQGCKRKAVDNTPNNIKKLRLSSSLSPANQKKNLAKPERSKKLF